MDILMEGGALLRYMKHKMDEMSCAELDDGCCSSDDDARDDMHVGLKSEMRDCAERTYCYASDELTGRGDRHLADQAKSNSRCKNDDFARNMDLHCRLQDDDTPRHANRRRRFRGAQISDLCKAGSSKRSSARNADRSVTPYLLDRLMYDDQTERRDAISARSKRRHSSRRQQQQQIQHFMGSLEYSSSEIQSPDSSSDEPYYNHAPIQTPANRDTPISTPNSESTTFAAATSNDPFLHLEQQLISMKSKHQSMSELLHAKSNNEIYLQSQLSQLQQSYAELQTKYDSLSSRNANIMQQSRDMERLLCDKDRELKVLQTKEAAVSRELADRLRKDDEKECRWNELMENLAVEKRERESVERELKKEKAELLRLQEANEQITHSNKELVDRLNAAALEKQSLQHDNTFLREEVASNDKQLAEAKAREASMCEQLMSKLALLESAEVKVQEHQTRLDEERRENNRQLEEERAKSRDLKIELHAMRDKVEAAKAGLAYLQRGKGVSKDTKQFDEEETEFEEKYIPIHTLDQSAMSVRESIELLSPIIREVLSVQNEIIQRAKNLLKQANATRHCVEQISETTASSFSFHLTLQLLEKMLTTHVNTMDELDEVANFEKWCQSELLCLLDLSPDEFVHYELADESKYTMSVAHEQYTKLSSAAKNHIKKVESLHKMALELWPTKSNNEKHPNSSKHTHVAYEIVCIFQQAMTALIQDTTQLSLVMDQ